MKVAAYQKLLALSSELHPLNTDITEKNTSALRNVFSKAEVIFFPRTVISV